MAKQKKSKMALYTRQDKIILYCGYALLGLFLLAIIVPMIYIVIASFMDPVTLQNKGISFDFSKWSLDAYQRVVSDKQIWVGFRNAVLYSIIFTIISVAVTMLAAYPMSLPDFKGKTIFNTLFVITMFFSGGLIPTYLLINNLGLLDSMWAVILPGAFSVWNMIIARTYYQGIPRELREAADVDGASEMLYFFKILLPVCMPVVAVLALWQFVAMWNSWRRHDLPEQRIEAAAAAGAAFHPDPEPAGIRHDRRYPKYCRTCEDGRAAQICNHYYFQSAAAGDVSLLPEVF